MNLNHQSIELEILRMYVEARLRNIPLQIFMLVSIFSVIAFLQPVWEAALWMAAGLFITGVGWIFYPRFLSKSLTAADYQGWLITIIVHRVFVSFVLCSLVLWAWNSEFPAGNLMLVLLIALQIPLSAMTGAVVLPVFYFRADFFVWRGHLWLMDFDGSMGPSGGYDSGRVLFVACMTFPVR